MRSEVTDLNKDLLLDLSFRTALLESVGWDETQSVSLLLYLQKVITENTVLPNDILTHIRDEYGDDAYSLIKEMFIDVYIENGLYINNEDDYEH